MSQSVGFNCHFLPQLSFQLFITPPSLRSPGLLGTSVASDVLNMH